MERTIFGRTALVLAATAMVATPAAASDDTKTGILAGLGVAAATGKTSLGGGAGAIEAGLLSADAYQQSAAIVAGVARSVNDKRKLVFVGSKDSIDLISAPVILDQIKSVRSSLKTAQGTECAKLISMPVKDPDSGKKSAMVKLPDGKVMILSPADLPGAILTDTSISPLDLSKSDGRLTTALMLTPDDTKIRSELDGGWHNPVYEKIAGKIPATVADENASWLSSSPIRTEYQGLISDLGTPVKDCLDKDGKSVPNTPWLEARKSAVTFAEGLTSSKDGPSVLARAIQSQAFVGTDPIIVRTTVEQIGGTSIARSGVLYTFGWPNAATVSAGLLVTFRIVDPKAATVLAVGEIRCLTPQTNIKKVRDQLWHRATSPGGKSATIREKDRTVCDYRAVKI